MNSTSPRTSDLGTVVQIFKPTPANVVAGIILGVLLNVGGVLLIAHAPLPKPEAAAFCNLLGAICIAGGLGLIVFAIRLAFLRVDLYERGFRHTSLTRADNVTWQDLAVIRLHVSAPDDEGAQIHPYITAITEQGRTYRFTANRVADIPAFVETLHQLTSRYEDLWQESPYVSKWRQAVFLIVLGVAVMAFAPITFIDIHRAEQHPGGGPVRVNQIVFLLYELGGKWTAVAGVFLIGLALFSWGVAAYAKADAPPRITKRQRTDRQTLHADNGTIQNE